MIRGPLTLLSGSVLLLVSAIAMAQEQAPAAQSGAARQEQAAKEPSAGATEKPADKPTDKRPAKGTVDRIELDSTSITGNRELPKVLYIVPWKKSGLGDLNGRPAHSLLDEVLAPVDREVFRRQTEYFSTLNPGTGPGANTDSQQTKPPAAPAAKSSQN